MKCRLLIPALVAGMLAIGTNQAHAYLWFGSQNCLHLGYNEPSGADQANKKTTLKNQFATNHVNVIQEVMKTAEMANVTPGGYVYKVSALKGPSTYLEAYGFIYQSSYSLSGGLYNYPEAGMDREPSAICLWTGTSYVWFVDLHLTFTTAANRTAEMTTMKSVYTYFKGYKSGVNDVIIGGDWNTAATHSDFNPLKSAGCTSILPDIETSLNSSGGYASKYDHFVWNPTYTSCASAARESVDPVYWRANISDHVGVYVKVND